MSWRQCLPRIPVVLACCLLLASPADAQSKEKVPKRPRLPEGGDTNSAMAYFQLGNTSLRKDVDKAADAFYWAMRLDPGWAAPVYGRYAALLLSWPLNDLELFLTNRDKAVSYPHLARLDSLVHRAELRNPFVDRWLDAVIIESWLQRTYGSSVDLRDFGRYNRSITAWAASSRRDFQMANTVYREEINRHPDDIDLRYAAGRNFFAQGQYDSARVMVQTAMELIRAVESDAPSVGWSPHAFGEYSVGFLYGVMNQWDSAGAAYERALLDDLSFHPAHHQLGQVRLRARDTAGALQEFTEAVTLVPGDATYLYDLGMLLMATGRVDSAANVLRRAVATEPFYPMPYFPLGVILESAGFTDEAVANYRSFLALAPRHMAPAIASARKRLERLQSAPTQ